MDRIGLGITTILASVVLQTEASVSKTATWLDMHFHICNVFQFAAFTITIMRGRCLGQEEKEAALKTSEEQAMAAWESLMFKKLHRESKPPPEAITDTVLENMFASVDTNGDGAIVAEELEIFAEARHCLSSRRPCHTCRALMVFDSLCGRAGVGGALRGARAVRRGDDALRRRKLRREDRHRRV